MWSLGIFVHAVKTTYSERELQLNWGYVGEMNKITHIVDMHHML